jgi:hypothetical protein
MYGSGYADPSPLNFGAGSWKNFSPLILKVTVLKEKSRIQIWIRVRNPDPYYLEINSAI